MTEVVIDTNVLHVAEGMHGETSAECGLACSQRLLEIKNTGTVVIDDGFRALGEYQRKFDLKRHRGAGAAFLKWLLQNKANPKRVVRVSLTETAEDCFAEFPDSQLEAAFDRSDRKFPAIANAHPAKPPILQAVDSKWLHWWPALAKSGIRVEFLCPDDICRFFGSAFPGKPVPDLP